MNKLTLSALATFIAALVLVLLNTSLYHAKGSEILEVFSYGLPFTMLVLVALIQMPRWAAFAAYLSLSLAVIFDFALKNIVGGWSFLKISTALLDTNAQEIAPLLSPDCLLYSFLAFTIAIGYAYLATRYISPLKIRFSRWRFLLAALSLPFMLILYIGSLYTYYHALDMGSTICNERRTRAFYPLSMCYDVTVASYEYYFKEAAYLKKLQNQDMSSIEREDQDAIQIYMIQGESVIASHASFNGYERETTPMLAAQSNLISFPKTLSFATLTNQSTLGMFTNATIAKPQATSPSLIHILSQAHFEIELRLGAGIMRNQKILFGHHPVHQVGNKTAYAPLAKHSTNSFTCIYTEGSHYPFKVRYPAEFKKWTPDDHNIPNTLDKITELKNAYDNSILYTDSLIAPLINSLKDRNALVIYAADHGEEVGEEGRLGRSDSPTTSSRKPLIFIWYSDIYAELYPERIAALRLASSQLFSHDHLFHTILGLSGIKCQWYDEALDLSKPQTESLMP